MNLDLSDLRVIKVNILGNVRSPNVEYVLYILSFIIINIFLIKLLVIKLVVEIISVELTNHIRPLFNPKN